MVRADVASTLPDVFAQHPSLRERSRHWTSLSDPVSTSPLIFRDPQPERDSVLMAGDAAGFVDPFVGDGISLALRSGSLAARCLAPFFAGKTSLPHAVSRYRELYQNRCYPYFGPRRGSGKCSGCRHSYANHFLCFWRMRLPLPDMRSGRPGKQRELINVILREVTNLRIGWIYSRIDPYLPKSRTCYVAHRSDQCSILRSQ